MPDNASMPADDAITRSFSRTTLFKAVAMDREAMQALAQQCRLVRYAAGETIIREGETGDRMYVLKSGVVRVRKRTLHGEAYAVSDLSADKEAFFGEVGLIDNDTRSATVTCSTPCEAYVVSRAQFLELGERYPQLALTVTREIARILCQRLRKANSDIITLFSALVAEVAESGGLESSG